MTTATVLDSKGRKISAMTIVLLKSKSFPFSHPCTKHMNSSAEQSDTYLQCEQNLRYILRRTLVSLKSCKYTSTYFDSYLIVFDMSYKVFLRPILIVNLGDYILRKLSKI